MTVTPEEVEQARQRALRRLEATVSSLITGPNAMSGQDVLRAVSETIARVRQEERQRAERHMARVVADSQRVEHLTPEMTEWLRLTGVDGF